MSPLIDHLWVGAVSDRFDECERPHRDTTIDVALAREQHELYVAALEAFDFDVRRLETDPAFPDSVFIEDTAVVLDRHNAVITRPGAPSRQGETEAVASALAADMELYRMTAPATLDGGDVLRVANRLFVGLSTRTNQAGAELIQRAAERLEIETTIVSLPKGLHLKSAASIADSRTLLYDASVGLELAPFRHAGLDCVAALEPAGGNVLALASGRVLVSAAAPRTADMLEARGMTVVSLALSEFHKADGALTCCSIRIPPKSGWCT